MAQGRHAPHHHHHDHNPPPADPGTGGTGDPGTGGTGTGGTGTGGTGTPPAPAPDFATLGATFNDATRALVGGLWQNAVEEGGQGNGSVFRYVSDLQTVSQ